MKKNLARLLLLAMLVASLGLFGCSGDDGSDGKDGATGPAGPAGPEGPAGPVTTTDESCAVCHGDGKIEEVAMIHEATAADVVITINSLTNAGGKAKVSVTLKSGNTPVPASAFETRRLTFTLSDLVPAGTDTGTSGTWATDYYKRWASENLTTAGAVVDASGAASGTYVFTFNTAFSVLGGASYPYTSPEDSQRLAIEWRPLDAALYNRAAAVFDFDVPAVDAAAVALAPQRVLAPIDGCQKCHTKYMDKAAHASSHLDTRICVTCHSPLYSTAMNEEGIYLTPFIHKIHAAIDVEAFPTRILGNGYEDVTYPQDIKNCVVCHTGGDNMSDAWKTHPTIEACASCHDVTFSGDAPTHTGGSQTNASCTFCHPADGQIGNFVYPVTAVHAVNFPHDYTTSISLSPAAAADGAYVEGEAFSITITVKDKNGNDVGGYETADYNANNNPTGVYSNASVYVYGPRAKAVPVLTTNSTTDPAYDPAAGTPTQGHSMQLPSSDPLVMTDATGFKYQTLSIPADLEPGTYMVMARITVAAENPDLHDGWALKTFQVGTATPELKVAGDGCNNCHNLADYASTAHRAFFGTDGCLACHDQSGNHAVPIANRVHAVHSAQAQGEGDFGATRDWSEVTYPQNLRCETCHDSGNTSYLADPNPAAWGFPCLGCHGSTEGARDHMIQMGAPLSAH